MIGLHELVFSKPFAMAALVALAFIVALSIMWLSYFKRVSVVHLNVTNLLSTISLGITGVSILLPTIGAILFYYLGQISADKLFTSYPLVIAIGYFGISLLFGLWNAFSFATQYEGGETIKWTRDYIINAVFFGMQFVWFVVALGLVIWFFLTAPLNVESLLKKPAATTRSITTEKVEAHTMPLPSRFDPIITSSLLPGEKSEDIKRAVEIILGERLRYSGRAEATNADAEVALLALCFPIPGGPPKKPKYEEEVRKIRKEKIADVASNPEKERKFRNSLQADLLGMTRERFYYPEITKFFRFERAAEA